MNGPTKSVTENARTSVGEVDRREQGL